MPPLFALDEIPSALAAILPERARLDFPPQGMTSAVAFATGTGRSVVVKRCADPKYLDWLRREHAVLGALAGTGLPIPDVIAYTIVERASGPEGWLATTKLPGRSLWEVVLETRAPARSPLLRRLGELMRRLHATPIPPPLLDGEDWLTAMLRQAQRNLPWCDGTVGALAELERTRPEPVPARLIHGDFALDNVLIDESGGLSLVDWSGGGAGDPRFDVALALQTSPETELCADELRQFYSGYRTAPLDDNIRRWFVQLWDFF